MSAAQPLIEVASIHSRFTERLHSLMCPDTECARLHESAFVLDVIDATLLAVQHHEQGGDV